MRRALLVFAFLGLLGLTPFSQRLSRVGEIGGPMYAVAPVDGAALTAEGNTLTWIDLAPVSGRLPALSRVPLRYGAVYDIATGSAVYVLTESGVLVMARNASGAWIERGFVAGGGQALAIGTGYVAVAARDLGLRIIDAARLEIAATFRTDGPALDVAVSGSVAHVALGESGRQEVDMNDPANPRTLATYPEPCDRIAIAGSALITSHGGRVTVTDGGARWDYRPLADGRRVRLRGNLAFIADAADGLKVYGLGDPARPVYMAGETGAGTYDLALDDRYVYAASGAHGLRIVDAGLPAAPVERSRVALPGEARGVVLLQDWALVAMGEGGLAAVSVLNKDQPYIVSTVQTAHPASEVTLSADGGTAYVLTARGLEIVSLLDISDMRVLGRVDIEGQPADLHLDAATGLIYVAGSRGLAVIHAADPRHPQLIRALAPGEDGMPPGHAYTGVTQWNRDIYLTGPEELLVIKADTSGQPTVRGRVKLEGGRVTVANGFFYVCGGPYLTVLSAAESGTPRVPGIVGRYAAPTHISALASDGAHFYLTNDGPGIQAAALKMADGGHLRESAWYGPLGYAADLAVLGPGAAVIVGRNGLTRLAFAGDQFHATGGYYAASEVTRLHFGGGMAFMAGGEGWSGVDAANPAMPQPASFGPEITDVRGMAVIEDTAYIAAPDAGILAYDVADPFAPRLIERVDGIGPVIGVAVQGRFLFAAQPNGVLVMDRDTLYRMSSVPLDSAPVGLRARGGLLYVPLSDGRLVILDARDARIPESVGVVPQIASDLVIDPARGRAFGVRDRELSVFDLSAPGLPTATTVELAQPAYRVALSGTRLYTLAPGRSVDSSQIVIYDVQNPTDPVPVGIVETTATDLAVRGALLYLAEGSAGLRVLSMTSLVNPTEVARLPGQIDRLLLDGARLYALNPSEIWTFQLQDDGSPVWVMTVPVEAESLVAAGDYVYAGRIDGLSVLDAVSGNVIGHAGFGAPVRMMQVIGGEVYALAGDEMWVISVSDPAAPQFLYAYPTSLSGSPAAMRAYGDHLLIAWRTGLEILQVSGESVTPRVLSVLEGLGGTPYDLTLNGPNALIGLGDAGVALIDVSDPAAPRRVWRVETNGVAHRAELVGNMLFVADGVCGLRAIDVSDSAAPREAGYWQMADSYGLQGAYDVVWRDGLLWVANGHAMTVLRYDPGGAPVLPPGPSDPLPAFGVEDVPVDAVLSWTVNADPCRPLRYEVWLGPDDRLQRVAEGESRDSSPETYQAAGLQPNTLYGWRVDVIDAQGDRLTGPVWKFSTGGPALPTPRAFTAEDANVTAPIIPTPAPPLIEDVPTQQHALPIAVTGGALFALGLLLAALLILRGVRRRGEG